jgi:hypothetical protein
MNIQLNNYIENSLSALRTLQVVGEDLTEGFTINHQDVLNLLDQVADNLKQIDSLTNHSSC